MRRIYHILTEAEPFSEHVGGAISRWAGSALRGDNTCVVIAPAADDSWGFPAERVRALSALAWYATLHRTLKVRVPWMIRRQLLQKLLLTGLFDAKKGDVIWVHNRPEFAAALAPTLRARGARLVLHMHNSHFATWPNSGTRHIGADSVVFVSRFLEKEARQKHRDLTGTTVLYNGADENLFFPRPEKIATSTTKILFAGRLVPEKGLHVFIGAMRRLHEKDIAAQAVIVGGSGFGRSSITAYIRSLYRAAPPNVRFEPYRCGESLAELFREADIFCLPSLCNDAFPLAPLEAMASKLPVVATQTGGIPEALSDGGGVLVERGSETALAKALEKLVTDRALQIRLGQEGYDSFRRNFTWHAVRKRYEEIVEGL